MKNTKTAIYPASPVISKISTNERLENSGAKQRALGAVIVINSSRTLIDRKNLRERYLFPLRVLENLKRI